MKGKEHRLKTRKGQGASLDLGVPLNFLLCCSQGALEDYALARLGEVADTRKELYVVMDRLLELMLQARLAEWFRRTDRASINQDLASEESPLEWAKRKISEGQRSTGELEDEFLPGLSLGAAHLAATTRYQARNKAEGKCTLCPNPLDPNSVAHCTKHMIASRARYQRKTTGDPGSADFLYQEEAVPLTQRGRPLNALVAAAIPDVQKHRAILAELGIPPEGAAVALDTAKAALLRVMPDKEHAQLAEELWRAAMIPSLRTGRRAIAELLRAGLIQSEGKGKRANPRRYWKAESKPQTRKPAISGKTKNQVLLQTLRGEEPDTDLDRTKRELASQHAVESSGRHLRGPRG